LVSGPSWDDRQSVSAGNLDRADDGYGPARGSARGPSRSQARRADWDDGIDGDREPGPRLGPIRITPTRVILVVAICGSLGFGLYTVTVRDPNQIPLLAAGLTVLGLVFGMLTVAGVVSTYRAGSDEQAVRAMFLAIGSGVASILALGCLAGAVLLAQLWTSGAR
jgi:hypothetical protein